MDPEVSSLFPWTIDGSYGEDRPQQTLPSGQGQSGGPWLLYGSAASQAFLPVPEPVPHNILWVQQKVLDPWYGIESKAWDISQYQGYLEMAYNSKQKFMMLQIRLSTAEGLFMKFYHIFLGHLEHQWRMIELDQNGNYKSEFKLLRVEALERQSIISQWTPWVPTDFPVP